MLYIYIYIYIYIHTHTQKVERKSGKSNTQYFTIHKMRLNIKKKKYIKFSKRFLNLYKLNALVFDLKQFILQQW